MKTKEGGRPILHAQLSYTWEDMADGQCDSLSWKPPHYKPHTKYFLNNMLTHLHTWYILPPVRPHVNTWEPGGSNVNSCPYGTTKFCRGGQFHREASHNACPLWFKLRWQSYNSKTVQPDCRSLLLHSAVLQIWKCSRLKNYSYVSAGRLFNKLASTSSFQRTVILDVTPYVRVAIK